MTECRYGYACQRPDCWYQHPHGRLIDQAGAKGNGKGFAALLGNGAVKGKGKGHAVAVDSGVVKGKGKGLVHHEEQQQVKGGGKGKGAPIGEEVIAKGAGKGGEVAVVAAPDVAGPSVRVRLHPDIITVLQDGLLYHLRRSLRGQGVSLRLEAEHLVLDNAVDDDAAFAAQAEVARLLSLRSEQTERLRVRQAVVKRLLGPQGKICQMLCRDLGVRIFARNAEDRGDLDAEAVVEVTGPPQVLERAVEALETHLVSFVSSQAKQAPAERQLEEERCLRVLLCVDNSNLAISCQYLPNGRRDLSQRLNITRLADAMVGVRTCFKKVVVGSKPPLEHSIWRRWEQAGFGVHLSTRNPDNREEFVDSKLVAEALMNVMHLHTTGQPPGVLVLGTGDGNTEGRREGDVGANFRELVTTVVRLGWRVEVWAWRLTCNACYLRMAQDPAFEGRLRICFLDGLRERVTFRQERAGRGEGGEDEDGLCGICMENEATHGFRPCAHRVCEPCARDFRAHLGQPPLGLCPFCRVPWTSIEEVAAGPARPGHE